jgi:L-ascorbate metabolism protein UlaG (beta-lactamase superfamily)/predicted methyltransferase
MSRVLVLAALLAAVLNAQSPLQTPRPREYASEEGWLPAQKVMDAIGLKPGMKVGEAGAGWGYFTFAFARRVGPQGVVYANDIDRASLTELDAYRQKQGDANVRTLVGAVDDPLFPAANLDLVVMVNAFHDFEKPVQWLVNARKYLKAGGQVAIIEIDPSKFPPDRPYNHAWSREKIAGYAAEAGYALAAATNDYKMHQILVFRSVGPGTAATRPAPDTGRPPLSLTYVANAGVLVAAGNAKVLIDALFDRPNPAYRAPSADTIEKMVAGAAPFDGVTLVLVTHNHPDHFDARVALRFLENRRDAVLVAPADAVEAMRGVATEWSRVSSRVVPIDGPVGHLLTRQLQGVSVTAMRTRHGSSEAPPNVMYLVEANGWRLFHEGDSPGDVEEYRRFGLGGAPVDLALVHFWFPFEPNCARFLEEVLRPDHVALTHLPIEREGDLPTKADAVRKRYKDLILLLPGMATRTFAGGTSH